MNLTKKKKFDFENKFYLSTTDDRVSKHLYQYEQIKKIKNVSGDILELGVFKGSSLARIILYRNLLNIKKKIYGFDVFSKLKKTKKDKDFDDYKNWSLKLGKVPSKKTLKFNLSKRNLQKNVYLIDGDIRKTLSKNIPKILSFVNLDLDIYDPTKHCLPILWSFLNKGGLILLDNYKAFPGETKAVNEFVVKNKIKINKTKFGKRIFYYLKK